LVFITIKSTNFRIRETIVFQTSVSLDTNGSSPKRTTTGLDCDSIPLNGRYTVQPVPTPTSTKLDNKSKAGGNNQKLKLFSHGKAIAGAPIKIGTNQLPNPTIKIGITIKKIIINT